MSSIMSDPITQNASNAVAQSLLPTKRTMTANANTATASAQATSSAVDTSGDITSNDFLTLLVTEMKNQDPTQPTDPQAYIQQLVGVNSLQQLISINQGLTTLEAGKTSSASAISSVSGIPGASPATATTSNAPNTAVSSAAVTNGVSTALANL